MTDNDVPSVEKSPDLISTRLAAIIGSNTIKKENFAISDFLLPNIMPVAIVAPDLEMAGRTAIACAIPIIIESRLLTLTGNPLSPQRCLLMFLYRYLLPQEEFMQLMIVQTTGISLPGTQSQGRSSTGSIGEPVRV